MRLSRPVSERDHIHGPETARVTLVEYADFECPSCGEAHPVIQAVRRAFGDNLRFVFRHFPLRSSHPHALAAAKAAVAAGAQGRFWEMHDRLFQRQSALTDDDLRRHARIVGLDLERFEQDRLARDTEIRVRQDLIDGTQSGVRGTPSLYVNGVLYQGPVERDALMAALARAALGRAG